MWAKGAGPSARRTVPLSTRTAGRESSACVAKRAPFILRAKRISRHLFGSVPLGASSSNSYCSLAYSALASSRMLTCG
jgi:hypothetical protein